MRLRLSTETGSAARLVGDGRAIEYIKRAGFDAYDFTMLDMAKYDKKRGCAIDTGHPLSTREYLSYARELRRIADDLGIVCNQTHAPHPTSAPNIRDSLVRALEVSAVLGADFCVIHPQNNESAEENAKLFRELLPYARECGVRIACENMWNWDKDADHARSAACSDARSFLEHLSIVDDEYLVACLDIGHAEMQGLGTCAVEMIDALGDKLAVLHVHDNDRHRDRHLIPFSSQIDFSRVAVALARSGYSGYITLEANRHLDSFTAEDVSVGLSEMYEAACRLRDMIEVRV